MRHLHFDRDDEIAGVFWGLDAFALDPMTTAGLRSVLETQRDALAGERWDVDLGAERCLGKRDGYTNGEVGAVTPKDFVGLHAAIDKQIAGRASVTTWRTATLDPNALPIGHASRKTHLHFALALFDSAATATIARGLDDEATTLTRTTWRTKRKEALVVIDNTSTAALRTVARRRAGLGARTGTGAALCIAGEIQRRSQTGNGIDELEVEHGFEIGATLGARAR